MFGNVQDYTALMCSISVNNWFAAPLMLCINVFLLRLCVIKMVRVYPKVVKWQLTCERGRSPKYQINAGCDHLQHEGLPGIVRAVNR